jgi:transposase-like protein
MSRILPAIDSLEQHLYHLEHQPEAYRPACCPHCGKGGVWCHGYYLRKADREGREGNYLDPVPIPRYYCPGCTQTCSRLPGCIAPRRWYLWVVQQAALGLLLSGSSLREAARQCQPGRRTISRWRQWLEARFTRYSFHLRSRFQALGRHASFSAFWSASFLQMSLATAMAWLDRDGVVIP